MVSYLSLDGIDYGSATSTVSTGPQELQSIYSIHTPYVEHLHPRPSSIPKSKLLHCILHRNTPNHPVVDRKVGSDVLSNRICENGVERRSQARRHGESKRNQGPKKCRILEHVAQGSKGAIERECGNAVADE